MSDKYHDTPQGPVHESFMGGYGKDSAFLPVGSQARDGAESSERERAALSESAPNYAAGGGFVGLIVLALFIYIGIYQLQHPAPTIAYVYVASKGGLVDGTSSLRKSIATCGTLVQEDTNKRTGEYTDIEVGGMLYTDVLRSALSSSPPKQC